MTTIAMAVHGGAGPDSKYIRVNARGYEEGLKTAIMKGCEVLEKKGNAVDAVEEAVRYLEDNHLFNAGRENNGALKRWKSFMISLIESSHIFRQKRN